MCTFSLNLRSTLPKICCLYATWFHDNQCQDNKNRSFSTARKSLQIIFKIPKYPCLAMPDNMLKLKCTENVRCWMNEAPIYHIRKKPKALQTPQKVHFSCWSLIHNSPTNNTTTSRGRFLGHWAPPATTWACYIHPLFSEWQSEMWCYPKYSCLFSASQALPSQEYEEGFDLWNAEHLFFESWGKEQDAKGSPHCRRLLLRPKMP